MYAINHATTALLIKKHKPSVPLFPLLLSTQLVEILWVIFNYFGIEHYSVENGHLHLDYLPYSHSVFSSVVVSFISYGVIRWIFDNKQLALPFAIGVLTHVALDVIFHEKDIRLSPFSPTPVWGLGIISHPWLNFILESAYGIFCWWYYGGNKRLLAVIVVFNLLDLPVMLASGDILNIFITYPFLLPTFILVQILITWYFVFKFKSQN